jgi:uncharacterized protein
VPAPTRLGLTLRLVFFFFLEYLGLFLFAPLIYAVLDYVAVGALSAFLAAAVANTVVLRIWERGQLDDVGLGWTSASRQHVLAGFGIGAAAAAVAIVLAAVLQMVRFSADTAPGAGFSFGRICFLLFLLLFGAVGEELLFRGYGFQVLLERWGARISIPLFALLFAYMHKDNLTVAGVATSSATAWLAMGNTFLWGLLLGYAVPRAGSLWLPIGLHFGWNMALPLLGVPLSGYTMGVTGYVLHWNTSDFWSGGAYGLEASPFTTLVVAGAAWLVWRLPLRRQKLALLESGRERES